MHLLDSELAPDSVLPAQLSELSLAGARLQPEKRLQVAVLADAVLTFHRLAGRDRVRARRLFAEVTEWFASDDADAPFTFVAICESLKFDPGYIRRGLSGPMTKKRFLRRDGNGTRHQVVLPRLRRVA
jgi:hypothetical protein